VNLTYHVNQPDIENRMRYTITTRRTSARDMHILADPGYVPIKTHVHRSGCVTVVWTTQAEAKKALRESNV
jgi:hypothetical protein